MAHNETASRGSAPEDLRARLKAANLTAQDVANRIPINPNILARILAGGMEGTSARAGLIEALERWERDGLPPTREALVAARLAEPRAQPDPFTRAGQLAIAAQVKARHDAILAEEADATRRRNGERDRSVQEEAAARGRLAVELRELRRQSGLTLEQMAAHCGVHFSYVQRMEAAAPVGGRNEQTILAQYQAAARLAGKAAKR